MLDGFPYVWPVEVRFRDLDALGHVNNAVFLTYLESARIGYWLELTGRTGLDAVDIILARVEIDYRSQASYRQQLDVGARIAAVGITTRMFFESRICQSRSVTGTRETNVNT